jgi:hypothetical protein
MSSKEFTMAKIKETEQNYRKVDWPKIPTILSNPDALEEALEDLDAYEDFSNTDELFNATDGGRMIVVKHVPFDDAEKAKKVKVTKKASEFEDESMKEFSIEDKDDELLSEKELNEILKDYFAYMNYLGFTDELEIGDSKDTKKH